MVEEVVKRGNKVSIVTNFSYPIENYIKLKEIAGENLSEILASLHIGQVKNIDEFLNKAKEFNRVKGGANFKIGAVLCDENVDELKKVKAFLDEAGIELDVQHLRVKNSFVKYGIEAEEFIKQFPISKIKKKADTYGKICRAGVDFVFIYQDGNAYRCYSSRFNKMHSIGNIKDKGFKLYDKPIPCLNKICTCPKPIMYNMIDFEASNRIVALLYSLYNAIFIPYYCVKNFGLIKQKMAQAVKLKK